LREIKTTAVQALQGAFQVTYPEDDSSGGLQPVQISVEYPVRRADMPAIWVDYEPAMLQTSGISYTEDDPDGNPLTRWRFQGHATFTIVAFSSNERDLIYDELVAMVAFAAQSQAPSVFRAAVENGTLIDTTWSFDTIEARGESAGMGTPWLSDEWIYERGIALQVTGDFVTDPVTMELVDLREIVITATDESDDESSVLTIG
jgi:hypothetical protein